VNTDRRNALAALTVAGLVWGLTVPLSKLALGWLPPFALIAARFALAAPILAWIARRNLRAALTPAVAGWGAVLAAGILGLQTLGLDRTSISHAALIFGAVPAFVAVLAAIWGRGTSGPLGWAGTAAALVGVGLVAGGGGGASASGDLLVVGSAVLSAFYILGQPSLLEGRDPVAVTAVQMGAGALATLPMALATEPLPTAAPAAGTALAFALLVVVGSLLPYALYAYAQARVEPELAGAFVNLEPLVGAVTGAFVFGDPFGGSQLAGALAILAGLALSVEIPLPRFALPAGGWGSGRG
jgi:drug/metabolite transporter (DMT)-like permease